MIRVTLLTCILVAGCVSNPHNPEQAPPPIIDFGVGTDRHGKPKVSIGVKGKKSRIRFNRHGIRIRGRL